MKRDLLRRNARRAIALFASILGGLFIAMGLCHGQGTIHITFDGPPTQPPGTGRFVQEYYETGMWFRPVGVVDAGNGFIRWGGGILQLPENGSAYVAASLGDSLVFSFVDSAAFDLATVDLAEYSTVVSNTVTVPFIGYRFDGSVVTTEFTTDGIIDGTGPIADFETFYFDQSQWTGLIRVEIPTYGWSLDNLIIIIPEPSAGALLLLGAAALWFRGRSVRNRSA